MRKFPVFNKLWTFKPLTGHDGLTDTVPPMNWLPWEHHGNHGAWLGRPQTSLNQTTGLQSATAQQPNAYTALLDEEAREADGTGNNLAHDDWGAAGTGLLRIADAAYADGAGAPYIGHANPRDISNAILDQDGSMPSASGVSDLFTFFGQFIDHDIDLTPESHGGETMGFSHADGDFEIARSTYQAGTGTGASNPREYPNVITSYVDASNIYGSHDDVTALLRADGGASAYMLTGEDGYLPTLGQLTGIYPGLDPSDVGGGPLAAGGDNPSLFVAGDVRANENNALTSVHTVWVREHNHQVDKLKQYMPDATNDELFKAARLIVEAEYQNIVFNEYLPLLLGEDNIPEYTGYNPDVDASVAIEFSTAAYRLGHSQISSTLHRLDEDGGTADGGHLGLFEAFFNPQQLLNGGIDALVRGLGAFKGQQIDENIVDDVRNLLFGGTEADPIDLGVFNILRNYDHGVPTLNEVRIAYGLAPLASFSDLTSDMTLQAQFASVYDSIDDVELWVGGLAEDKYFGSQLGETFHTIVLDQFMHFRDGDRFYFEERLEEHPELLAMVKNTSFSEILLRATGIDYFQDDAFIAHNRIGGGDGGDTLWGTDEHDLMIGFGGRDSIHGGQGDDDLYGGAGRDKLYAGDGRDVVFGEAGSDTAYGGAGDDLLDGGAGNDTLHGEDGDDTLLGGAGRDVLLGGYGDDHMSGGDGNDQLWGHRGDDTLIGGDGRDTLGGESGNDTIDGGAGRDTLIGGEGADTFVLSDFDMRDVIADYEFEDTIDLTALLDVLDTDGEDGLTQGDVDNAVRLNWGDLAVDNPDGGGFESVATVYSAYGGVAHQVSVVVDDAEGNQATFTV